MKKQTKERKIVNGLIRTSILIGFIYTLYSTNAIQINVNAIRDIEVHINSGVIVMMVGAIFTLALHLGDRFYDRNQSQR